MFVDHEYIGKWSSGDILVEIYDTGKRTWTFKKIYAYQVFKNNKLIRTNERVVVGRKDNFLDEILKDPFTQAGQNNLLIGNEEWFDVVKIYSGE